MRKLCCVGLMVPIALLGMPVGVLAETTSPAATGGVKQGSQQQTGNVAGLAKNTQQQNLPKVEVRVRAANGQIVAQGVTDAAGKFEFKGLTPGSYIVEVVDAAGNLVGTASITVTGAETATVTITAAAAGAIAAAGAGGFSLFGLGTIGTIALVGTVAALTIVAIEAARRPASPSR